MRVLILSSEVFPYAKTGGLGDVAGALPRALAALGVDVAVAMPYYRKVRARRDPVDVVAEKVPCLFSGEERPFRLLKSTLKGSENVPIYFVQNEGVFEEGDDIYGAEPGSYGDGHLRFLYFSYAALEIPRAIGFRPDVWHLQDWQTAAVAPLLRTVKSFDRAASDSAAVLTIHNLAYQGVFEAADLRASGVPEELLVEGKLLHAGRGNLMAGGVRFAEAISTVSRTYAREILTPSYGAGLDDVLRARETSLVGIVNGLDLDVWNPSKDAALVAAYDADSPEGKRRNKEDLLRAAGLDPTDGPVFGVVSRFTGQKGLDLVPPVIDRLLSERDDVRLVALGSGEPEIEDGFRDLAARRKGRVHARFKFDEAFSHRVEAGVDFFLMPSTFEPCGLNQLISMRYGTPPIVRATGGLHDTVVDPSEAADERPATGFKFAEKSTEALLRAVRRALSLYDDDRPALDAMRRAGMTEDWSWEKAARDYVTLFETALDRRRRGAEHLYGLVDEAAPVEVEEPFLPPFAALPDWYPRDVLDASARDPWTLFVAWELGGDASRERYERYDEVERLRLRHVLRIVDAETRGVVDYEVGFAKDWFATVAPGRTYEVELLARGPDGVLEQILTAPPVATPPALGPDDEVAP